MFEAEMNRDKLLLNYIFFIENTHVLPYIYSTSRFKVLLARCLGKLCFLERIDSFPQENTATFVSRCELTK